MGRGGAAHGVGRGCWQDNVCKTVAAKDEKTKKQKVEATKRDYKTSFIKRHLGWSTPFVAEKLRRQMHSDSCVPLTSLP